MLEQIFRIPNDLNQTQQSLEKVRRAADASRPTNVFGQVDVVAVEQTQVHGIELGDQAHDLGELVDVFARDGAGVLTGAGVFLVERDALRGITVRGFPVVERGRAKHAPNVVRLHRQRLAAGQGTRHVDDDLPGQGLVGLTSGDRARNDLGGGRAGAQDECDGGHRTQDVGLGHGDDLPVVSSFYLNGL